METSLAVSLSQTVYHCDSVGALSQLFHSCGMSPCISGLVYGADTCDSQVPESLSPINPSTNPLVTTPTDAPASDAPTPKPDTTSLKAKPPVTWDPPRLTTVLTYRPTSDVSMSPTSTTPTVTEPPTTKPPRLATGFPPSGSASCQCKEIGTYCSDQLDAAICKVLIAENRPMVTVMACLDQPTCCTTSVQRALFCKAMALGEEEAMESFVPMFECVESTTPEGGSPSSCACTVDDLHVGRVTGICQDHL